MDDFLKKQTFGYVKYQDGMIIISDSPGYPAEVVDGEFVHIKNFIDSLDEDTEYDLEIHISATALTYDDEDDDILADDNEDEEEDDVLTMPIKKIEELVGT